MLWAGIARGFQTPLVIMTRDPESPRNSYSAKSYIWALEKGLLPVYEPGMPFQQDNVSRACDGGGVV